MSIDRNAVVEALKLPLSDHSRLGVEDVVIPVDTLKSLCDFAPDVCRKPHISGSLTSARDKLNFDW